MSLSLSIYMLIGYLYLLFFILNFCISFAYLQRSGLKCLVPLQKSIMRSTVVYKHKSKSIKKDYLRSIISSLPGPFGFFGIIKGSHFPKYGIKIFPRERIGSVWFHGRKEMELSNNDGKYRNIWTNMGGQK